MPNEVKRTCTLQPVGKKSFQRISFTRLKNLNVGVPRKLSYSDTVSNNVVLTPPIQKFDLAYQVLQK